MAGRIAHTLADTTMFAEGIDADRRSGTRYVASVRWRTIVEVRPDGRVRDLHLERHPRVGAILDVRVAPDRRFLYATTAGIPQMRRYVGGDSTLAAVLRVRVADGGVDARWDVPPDGVAHVLGDLAIAGDGTVYASDSRVPILYRLARGARALEPIRHPLFRSLQGIAPIPGTSRLIVSDYSHGLLRVDTRTGDVTRLVDAPSSTSLGVDGIVWHDGGIIGVQNGLEPARTVLISVPLSPIEASRRR